MRLAELFLFEEIESKPRAKPRVIRTSSRFAKEWRTFADAFPDFARLFEEFLKAKVLYDPPARFGKKDAPFSPSSPLKGFWHAHIIFGKALVHYTTDRDHLSLLRVTDHLSVETGRIPQFAKSLTSMDASEEWTEKPTTALPADISEKALELFRIMSEHPEDFKVLRTFAAGGDAKDMDVYLEMAGITVDPETLRPVARLALKR
jgi:hypothetical protein